MREKSILGENEEGGSDGEKKTSKTENQQPKKVTGFLRFSTYD